MKTVVITDGKYRSAIAVARALGRAGYRVVVTQTRADADIEPPVFSSRFAEGRWIEGGCGDPDYADRLLALLAEFGRPVLLCVGAASLQVVSAQRERFSAAADFLIAAPKTLALLNDKQAVHERAQALGLPVPEEFAGLPPRYPVVLKPHCGEALGLKAAQRYAIAKNEAEYRAALAAMQRCDPQPIVQEYISGDGRGVSVLMGKHSELLAAIGHRRIREYPYTGGPSTCCVTEYDEGRVTQAARLLQSVGFVGLAMVEFKGDRILEVNPRVWGTFPLTVFAGAGFCEAYAAAARGEAVEYAPCNYPVGLKMRYLVNDLAADFDLLRHGKPGACLSGLLDVFRVKEALYDPEDKAAYRSYLRSYFKR